MQFLEINSVKYGTVPLVFEINSIRHTGIYDIVITWKGKEGNHAFR